MRLTLLACWLLTSLATSPFCFYLSRLLTVFEMYSRQFLDLATTAKCGSVSDCSHRNWDISELKHALRLTRPSYNTSINTSYCLSTQLCMRPSCRITSSLRAFRIPSPEDVVYQWFSIGVNKVALTHRHLLMESRIIFTPITKDILLVRFISGKDLKPALP